ncbi:hypothetical protein [Dyadobacter frigoris]|uniref:Uncharacterized protein n=1 Tax=Dyadobacter frigoris TaxID=2576211 RepID=A0A4U6DAC0_9BACT|nr:hypothetical protein [Dyadobacter frigoris]TKT93341.1 hypothetical protein FDK13_05685 [Dyadobacter frigoris]
MAYKYIYIDDTQNEIEQGTINGLEIGREIEITFKKPADWETLISSITEMMPDYNGIILDLRLNGNPYEGNKYAQYRGSTLAQELRTLSKESLESKDFPIILVSADENLEKSFDPTSLDLFDLIVSKNILGNDKKMPFELFRDKLKWLSDGYNYLNECDNSIEGILGRKPIPQLDTRFLDALRANLEKPKHIIARFLTKQIIGRPTFLIDERYLSARLGVDRRSGDWGKLINNFLPADMKYVGAFSNYYTRWWMQDLYLFWEEKVSDTFDIRSTGSKKKVELLSAKSGLTKLTPLEKQSDSKSDSFWVICKATGVAIDTTDAFIIAGQDDKHAWQEHEYVSVKEALRPTAFFGITSIEKPRLEKLKAFLEKNEKRVRE